MKASNENKQVVTNQALYKENMANIIIVTG